MNTRERCMNILHYKDADRIPAVHFGYWRELLDEWAEQGHISKELAQGAIKDGSAADRELDKIIGWDCGWNSIIGVKNQIMIGGAPISQEYCDMIGADCYTVDAASAADAAEAFCKA